MFLKKKKMLLRILFFYQFRYMLCYASEDTYSLSRIQSRFTYSTHNTLNCIMNMLDVLDSKKKFHTFSSNLHIFWTLLSFRLSCQAKEIFAELLYEIHEMHSKRFKQNHKILKMQSTCPYV